MGKGMFDTSGDLGKKDNSSMKKAFPRPIKRSGGEIVASKELPYRKPASANDDGGSSGGHA